MVDYLDTYYTQTMADDAFYAPLSNDASVDICVIGGGLAGLNIALEAVLAGQSVIVLEANRIAWGASGRNGGFVMPSYSLGAHELEKKVGLPHAKKLYRLLDHAMETIQSRIVEYNIAGVSPVHGIMKVTLRENREGIKDYCDYMTSQFSQRVEYWDKDRLSEILKTTRYNDGALYPGSFHFHGLNYARGIARHAVGKGAIIHENSRVISFDPKTKTVHTDRAVVKAKDIVFACSGYIGGLNATLGNAIVPVATYVVCTEPLHDRLHDVIRVPYAVIDERFANDYYRPLADTRILWGGRVSVTQPSPERVAAMLHRDMLQVFPQLHDVKIETAWGCYMGYPRHKMPQIGQYQPGLWYCTGFGGYGMTATTVGAKVITEALLGDTKNIDLFKPFGLQFTGGRLIAPLVTQTMYWGYQTMDWLRAVTNGKLSL